LCLNWKAENKSPPNRRDQKKGECREKERRECCLILEKGQKQTLGTAAGQKKCIKPPKKPNEGE